MRLILDGNNYANIAFYQAMNILRKKRDDENYIESLENMTVKVFLNMLHRYMKDHKGTFYIIWDGRNGAGWRKKIDPEYKANREQKKDSYKTIFVGMNKIINLLNHYPIIQMEFENCEADDIIYTLCEIDKEEAVVFSTDGDMMQLPQKFDYIKVFNPRKKEYTPIPEYDVVTVKSLMGDGSDNIAGLYKVGPKTALKYMNGEKTLTEEQIEIVEKNKILVDMALNPHRKENAEKVNKLLKTSKIIYNKDQVRKMFFEYKLGEFIKRWGNIDDLINELTEGINNGGKKTG